METHHDSQRALSAARVLLIGLGGLGTPAAIALADAGVGTLGLVDPDVVEISNLHRQPLYEASDVGERKVDAARRRLVARRPALRVETWAHRFEAADGPLLRDWDVVLDGTDSAATKFMVNDAAVAAGVPLVHAGATGWAAQLLTILPAARLPPLPVRSARGRTTTSRHARPQASSGRWSCWPAGSRPPRPCGSSPERRRPTPTVCSRSICGPGRGAASRSRRTPPAPVAARPMRRPREGVPSDEYRQGPALPRVRRREPGGPAARLRDLLRSARGGVRLRASPPHVHARGDRGAPAQPLALPRAAAGRGRAARSACTPASRRWSAPTGSRRRSASRSSTSRTTPSTTRRSRTRIASSRWRSRRRSSSASTPSPAPRPATSPTPSRHTPRAPVSTATSSSPTISSRERSSARRSTARARSPIRGNYDDVNRLCSEIADKYGWAFVNINIRPYYTEGAKTYGFEIAEQLGWKLPQHIVVPDRRRHDPAEDRQGVPGAAAARPGRGRLQDLQRAGGRLRPGGAPRCTARPTSSPR